MIIRGEQLSVKRQSELLGLHRGGVYYTPRAVSEEDLKLMRRIDELHLQHPFYGARRLAKQLSREGFEVGRLHVSTLMRRMGIEALYRRPRTSIPARDALIYPYLLDGLVIERANQVWASDLTYLPMAHGFMYLVLGLPQVIIIAPRYGVHAQIKGRFPATCSAQCLPA